MRNTQSRQRKEGGGRKKKNHQSVCEKIEFFINPHTRGEPESSLQWVSKSLSHMESALKATGNNVSHRIIGEALKEHGFGLQSNRKRFEGSSHEDRDAQFEFIQKKVDKYISERQPVISVDAKKRELVGNFADKGVEWHPVGMAESVNAYDFLTEAVGVAVPYGVYNIRENIGWVNIGITKDTACFAVQSIRNWRYKMRIYYHNRADSLLITADDGGSNSSKSKLWEYELQKFANETGLTVEVAHFPPGTSKWNKIEHRLFSYISKNWKERPLVSYQVIVSLIAGTETAKGLKVGLRLTGMNIKPALKFRKNNSQQSIFVPINFMENGITAFYLDKVYLFRKNHQPPHRYPLENRYRIGIKVTSINCV